MNVSLTEGTLGDHRVGLLLLFARSEVNFSPMAPQIHPHCLIDRLETRHMQAHFSCRNNSLSFFAILSAMS